MEADVAKLLAAQAHIGTKNVDAGMKEYVWRRRIDGVHILNVASTLEKLKLAHVDVNFTMAVLPLNKTITDVDQAATLINQGKYYEANAALKSAQDNMRFDVIDAIAVPQKATAATADKGAPQATGTTAGAKTSK